MIRGSCMCGGVKYEITGPLTELRYCHCSICRKAHGSAFRSRARVEAVDFRFVQGEDLLTFYASSPRLRRGFCRVCGSSVISKSNVDSSFYSLALGTLDDDPGVRPALHIFVADKAPWFTITDDLPQFPQMNR